MNKDERDKNKCFEIEKKTEFLTVKERAILTFFRGIFGGIKLGVLVFFALLLFTVPDLISEFGSPEAHARIAVFFSIGAIIGLIAMFRAWIQPIAWEVRTGIGITIHKGKTDWHIPLHDLNSLRLRKKFGGRKSLELVLDKNNIYILSSAPASCLKHVLKQSLSTLYGNKSDRSSELNCEKGSQKTL